MKTIQMTIDPRLLKAVDKLRRLRKTTRSALIRGALQAELRRERINDLEARHARGYARQPVTPGEFDAWIDQSRGASQTA
jgi:metal-responsive CopG/Arc/MetJ family transcriptional regulator